jgi:hypothetical protein
MIPDSTMRRILSFLAFAAAVSFGAHVFSGNRADVDLWGNLGFVTAWPWQPDFHYFNPFCYTDCGHRWINHEWLAELILRRLWEWGGGQALIVFKALAGLTIVGLMYAASRRARPARGSVAFLFLLLVMSTMSYGFAIRPHHFSYLLLSGLLYFLAADAGLAWLIVMAPFLGFLWVNLHGAFFIGVIVLAVFALARFAGGRSRDGQVLAVATMSFLAGTLISPYGLRLWKFVVQSASQARPQLDEWAPVGFSGLALHADFAVLLAISMAGVVVSLRSRRGPLVPDGVSSVCRSEAPWLVLLGLAALSAFVLKRNIPLFAIIAGFVAIPHVDAAAGEVVDRFVQRMAATLRIALLCLLLGGSCWAAVSFNRHSPGRVEVSTRDFPVDIVAAMKEQHVAGNLLVFFDWAEYCIWHLDPLCKVFLDGRFTDAYRPETARDYFDFLYGAPAWRRALDSYPTDLLLLHKGNPACSRVAGLKEWRAVAENDYAVLFALKASHPELAAGLERRPPPGETVLFPGP